MESYSLTLDEACQFLKISRPTATNWIRTGRLQATRKDPTKPKSPYLTTRQACIAALQSPLHTVQVSAGDGITEERKCHSSAEMKYGMPRTACKVLRDQIGKHHKWVFVHTKAAKRADGTSTPAVRKMRIDSKTSWLSACRRAGIEDFRFHDLRHTWASWLIQSGVPLSVLQEMGGWESIEMVRRYAHLAPNHLTEHARKIDDIFGDNVPNMSHSGIMEDIKKA
ncbi:TPA: tyrosine-type recombinase/integrase [Escherichia coli]|nr:tyrosine-type recombinase/integrase [Escherichia coli]MDN0747690.1 helix-turn-helix domain-containing protein [Escherichia coli]HBB9539475.1 tyrosine-type recombinase/integrase [Escherichia coli]HCN5636372.1 tyrosine-type recombinase/integrase [Escherichia coli]